MVINGHFSIASYEYLSSGNSTKPGMARVMIESYMEMQEVTKLQNALINRRGDLMQINIDTAATEETPEIVSAPTTDKPSTETESW